MPNKKLKIENGKWKINPRFPEISQLSTFNFQLKSGFSFIELLVVITIMGLLVTISFAAFLNYTKSTKLTNAALQLKNDLRFVQNKALAGDKSTPICSSAGRILVGWYLEMDQNTTSYSMNGICKNSSEVEQPEVGVYKTFSFPEGVTATNTVGNVRVLFQPLEKEVTVHNKVGGSPYFYNTSGSKPNQVSVGVPFVITLSSTSGSYQVTIQPSGEISEKKL